MAILKNYIEPTSVVEAEDRLRDLWIRSREIEAQLADHNRCDPATGERLSDEQYAAWHSKAVWAHKAMLVEQLQIKEWLREQRVRSAMQTLGNVDPQRVDLDNPTHVLWLSFRAMLAIAKRGDLHDDETTVLDLVRHYLETHADTKGQ